MGVGISGLSDMCLDRVAMSASGRVLVLGDDTRSFLATVRSLGAAGLRVSAVPFNFGSPALRSRYIAEIHRLPDYVGDGREWLEAISDLLAEYRFDLVIPCDERALLPLYAHRQELSQLSRLATPDPQAFEIFFDKLNTRRLAAALGIPIARGDVIDWDLPAENLAAIAGLPIAIKPRSSYSIDHLYSRNRVEIATDVDQLAKLLVSLRNEPVFYEEYFPGVGAGISVLARNGHVLQAFQHRRARELAGTSHYRVSTPVFPPFLDAASKLVGELAYTGLAMFEFRIAPDNSWVLLEVNARPWGSLPLPVALGMDFPFWWYQLLVDGSEPAARGYREGIYGRNLIPDAKQVLHQLRTSREPFLTRLRHFLCMVMEYTRILYGREVYDVLKLNDPRPGLSEIGGEIREFALARLAKLPGVASRSGQQARRSLRQALAKSGAGTPNVVLVCQGNICRSPFAAELLRAKLGRDVQIQICSAGNLPRENATSPPFAVEAASDYGIDLSHHRSRHFSQKLAESATVILIFDEINRRWIEERYPALGTPIIVLGNFSHDSTANPVISDPDGADLATFQKIYSQIAQSIDGLAVAIRETAA